MAFMAMLECDGTNTFYREKQNEPLDPDACIFREENFHYRPKQARYSPMRVRPGAKNCTSK
jgi:hypothetical protein